MRRKRRFGSPAMLLALAFLAAAFGLSSVQSVPVYQTRTRTFTESVSDTGSMHTGPQRPGAPSVPGGGPIVEAPPGLECPGRNGGATDRGVTATTIKLGGTMVKTGIGKSFLADAPDAMNALTSRVNREGGVCGRRLVLRMVDDGWAPDLGHQDLLSLIDEGVFALAVSPSSEGVNLLIASGDLDAKGVPLVGADGMVASMYVDPWVWPVAASTVSTMHIIAQTTPSKDPTAYAIVFENDYHFGREGALAFDGAVLRKTGRHVPGFDPKLETCLQQFCAVSSKGTSFSTEVSRLKESCHIGSGHDPTCALIAMLMEPTTALNWIVMSDGPVFHAPGLHTMGPQPLFSTDFAKKCGDRCNNLIAWTSYKPPIAPYASDPAVLDYARTVHAADPSLDVTNGFTEGAYAGMATLVEGLRRVGPNLTRANLRRVLNSGTYDVGLTPPTQWREGKTGHFGTGQMQGYEFVYQGSSFIALRQAFGWTTDKELGLDL